MADRYWVGGTGTWDVSSTANWSATSGGAGGASAPTSADNVIFNSASNTAAATITIGTNAVCKDWTISQPTAQQTLSLSATSVINVWGSISHTPTSLLTISAASGSIINLVGEGTIAIAPNSGFGSVTFRVNTTSGTAKYTLAANLTASSCSINTMRGHLDTNGYSVSCLNFQGGGIASATVAISLGASTISVISLFELLRTSVITLNKGTSKILLTSANAQINNQGYELHDVAFTAKGTGTVQIVGNGASIYNNLSVDSPSSAGTIAVRIPGNTEIKGTLTFGLTNAPDKNIVVYGDVAARRITANAIAPLSNVTFIDIIAMGASAPWSGTRLGDGGGNTSIVFDAPMTRYWYSVNQAAAGWKSASWCNSPAETVGSLDNIPLAQDTVVFRDQGLVSGATLITTSASRTDFATLDASARTLPMNFNFQGSIWVSKDIKLSEVSKWSTLANSLYMAGKGAMSITSKGNLFSTVYFYTANPAVLTFEDNFDCTAGFTMSAGGTIKLKGADTAPTYKHRVGAFASNNSIPRIVDFGTGAEIHITGTNQTVYNTTTDTGLSYLGNPIFRLVSNASAGGTRTFQTANNQSASAPKPNFYIDAGADNFHGFYVTGDIIFSDAFTGQFNNSTRYLFGSLRIGKNTTVQVSPTLSQSFIGNGDVTLTTSSKLIPWPLTFTKSNNGKVTMQDDLNVSSAKDVFLLQGTLALKSGTVNSLGNFLTTGTLARTLKSDVDGETAEITQATGTVNLSYTTLKDVKPKGGAIFNAYTGAGNANSKFNVNNGNTEGWKFIPSGMTMMGFM